MAPLLHLRSQWRSYCLNIVLLILLMAGHEMSYRDLARQEASGGCAGADFSIHC